MPEERWEVVHGKELMSIVFILTIPALIGCVDIAYLHYMCWKNSAQIAELQQRK